MPCALSLPTTSSLDLTECLSSDSHPALPYVATSYRNILRNKLKNYKRLPLTSQSQYVVNVIEAADDYLPYILAISNARGPSSTVENLVVQEYRTLKSEWRSPLATRLSGRVCPKLKFSGLEFEVAYVILVKATGHYIQATARLLSLYDEKSLADDQRVISITGAVKSFIEANAAYTWLSQYTKQSLFQGSSPDLAPSTLEALARLALAEATLATVSKDDPYPALVAQARNPNDKEWMIKPPSIPQVRAHVLSRLCLASAEHAQIGHSLLIAHKSKLNETLPAYLDDFKCMAKARACRFLGIHAELSGRIGESIAWLQAANKEIGIFNNTDETETKATSIKKWKLERADKREEKKISKGPDRSSAAGKWEERQVIDTLMRKWRKLNNMVQFEEIPSIEQVIQNLPSGRDIYISKSLNLPILESDTLATLQADPDTYLFDSQQETRLSSDDEDIVTDSQYY